MAQVNRYTQLTPARYNPRTMQEMMMLPAMQRQKHDQSVSYAAQMGMFNNKALQVDQPKVDAEISAYEEEINKYVEDLAKNGINENTTQGLIQLARQRKEMEKKTINPAESNYNKVQEYAKELMATKGWSQKEANQYAQAEISKFSTDGGTFRDNGTTSTFQGRYMPEYIDANKRLDEAIEKVKANQYQTLMTKYDIEGVNDLHTFMQSDKVKSVDKNKIINAIQTELSGDLKFQESYMTQSMLAGEKNNPFEFGEFKEVNGKQEYQVNTNSSLDRMLYGKALGAEYIEQSKDFSQIKASADQLAAQLQTDPGTYYKYDPVERAEIFRAGFMEQINNVAGGVIKETPGGISTSAGYSESHGLIGTAETKEAKSEQWNYNMLSKENKALYDEIATKLYEGKNFPADVKDIHSQAAFKHVADYLAPFKDVAIQNTVIEPHKAMNLANQGAALVDKDLKTATQVVKRDVQYGDRRVWDENGELVDTSEWDFEKGQFDYMGYYSANNHIDGLEGSNPLQMVMPHQMGYDGKKYYVERTQAEMDRPAFKAASLIKDATYKGMKQPLLPVTHVPDEKLTQLGVNSIETRYNPLTNTMSVKVFAKIPGAERLGYDVVEEKDLPIDLFNNMMSDLYNNKLEF